MEDGKSPRIVFGDELNADKVPDDTLNGDVDIYLENIATEYKVSYTKSLSIFPPPVTACFHPRLSGPLAQLPHPLVYPSFLFLNKQNVHQGFCSPRRRLPGPCWCLRTCQRPLAISEDLHFFQQVTAPVASTTFSGGKQATVTWIDNGQAPTLKDFGAARISIYVGNALQQVHSIVSIIHQPQL